MNAVLVMTAGKGEIHFGIGAIRPVPECPTGINGMIPKIWISFLESEEIVIIKNLTREKIKTNESQELVSFCGFNYIQRPVVFVKNYRFQKWLFERLREKIGTIEWKTELSERIGNDYSMAYLPMGLRTLMETALEEKPIKIIEPTYDNFE
jgi:hypothetical protein